MLCRLLAMLALMFLGCGGPQGGPGAAQEGSESPKQVSPAPTLSALGESCTKTADCTPGLRCIQLTCVSPGGPATQAKALEVSPEAPAKAPEVAEVAKPGAGGEGKFGDLDQPSKDEKSALKKKIDPKKVRLNDLLATNKLEGVGAIENIMKNSTTEGFSNKLAVAMSGAGTEFVVGHGSGGMGFKGTGTGGGGVGGYGRIHGLGKIDTGGGMGVKAGLGKKGKRRVGKMRFRAMNTTGFCKKSDIRKRVKRRAGAIRACYERVLMRKPRLSGKVMTKWRIGLSGKVQGAVSTSGRMPDGSVKSCIGRVIQRIRFAKPQGGVCIVRQSIEFKSR